MKFNVRPSKCIIFSLVAIVLNCFLWPGITDAQIRQPKTSFTVSMPDPGSQQYHVHLIYSQGQKALNDFHMCAWTPGFYELIDFSSAVTGFNAKDEKGNNLPWKKTDSNTWQVANPKRRPLIIDYDVKAIVPFVGNIYLDEHYGYIIPGGLLMYVKDALRHPVTLEIKPYAKWPKYVATGLKKVPKKKNIFYAADFDELYDSPLLMGNLEALPSFTVNGIPHQFAGYNLGDFDRRQFIADLQKITKSAVAFFGNIPFRHYTFLATGMSHGGFGGVEHLNSTSLMLGNKGLMAPDRKATFYEFLAHEYFHLYNAKRIRPVELGPFDYSKENKTDLLWISEGFTDYYEYLIVRGAGLIDDQQVLAGYQEHIGNYENTPGHLYQTLSESSRSIWSVRGAPTTRDKEELSKTISVYDKGCALAMLLDLKIRHETQNLRSLDDVMRLLYHDYYQVKKRGFTGPEFWITCKHLAGVPLDELISYSTTLKPVDYPKYFAYAGLAIDTNTHHLDGNNLGITAAVKDSSLLIKAIAWNSPAFKAGLQQNDRLISVGHKKAALELFASALKDYKTNDTLSITVSRANKTIELKLKLTSWDTRFFTINPMPHPDQLQMQIYNGWLRHSEHLPKKKNR
ncbi:M61 family metallopeptidase [Mucilaginibacter flavus]|uniref:M61 family metallopeptidase n=1 Tax=Mucilaginibacter flavus TaxID=931504 RepID=UPI0025B5476C|nr:PDZ domain-containing protein [Mucilaginibacter flavus]MDN3584607.1 PDZ domain-containing protein [Mucilaginibacter flavus]